MNREYEVAILASVLIMLRESNAQEADGTYVRVDRRTLGFMADTFRKAGVNPETPGFGTLALCSVCKRALDPEKGELFVGEDGEPYCNHHYEEDRRHREQLELELDRIADEHNRELDRKLRQRPTGGT